MPTFEFAMETWTGTRKRSNARMVLKYCYIPQEHGWPGALMARGNRQKTALTHRSKYPQHTSSSPR